MHSFLVAGRENFPRQTLSEITAEPVLCEKNWTTMINLLKWSEVLQTEGFRFNSW